MQASLTYSILERSERYQELTKLIEDGPHNTVHDNIGIDMGALTTAANDPIFYLHHGMVDKLWARWQRMDETRFNDYDSEYLNQTYRKTDVLIERTAGEMLDYRTNPWLCYEYVDKQWEDALDESSNYNPAEQINEAMDREPVVNYEPMSVETMKKFDISPEEVQASTDFLDALTKELQSKQSSRRMLQSFVKLTRHIAKSS